MRAFKFLNAEFGLKSLAERRLRISRLDELNDPFELIPFDLRTPRFRFALKQTRAQLTKTRGLLCFSAKWRDPVLWAHYSDKHRGICLGFEVPDEAGIAKRVQYVSRRLTFPPSLSLSDTSVAEAMLFTKYSSWQYEEEIRIFLALNDEEDGNYYRAFDNTLRLVMVIAGARCELSEHKLTSSLGELADSVKLIKARAGFGKFEVVEDQRGFR
jgi:Protein of unknown function (DUF2971)